MCGSIFSYYASSVQAKDYRKALQSHVMYDLVVCSLRE
jgi:hypothetical protein